MPRIVVSEIKGFKGRVTLCEPLTVDQLFAYEDAQDKAFEAAPSALLTKINEARGEKDEEGKPVKGVWASRESRFFVEAILKCAEKFEVERMEEKPTLDNFPFTPRPAAREFIQLLWNALTEIVNGETEIPNAS